MPFILGLIGVIAAAYFWANRARNAAHIGQDLVNVAGDVMSAARRLGFRRRADVHPVESVDDTKLATGALALAFLELGSLPTAEDHESLIRSMQSHLDLGVKDAEEMLILGRWLVNECNGPMPAVTRLSKRLVRLDRAGSLTPLMSVLNDVGQTAHGDLSDTQKDALAEISRRFKLG